MIIPSPKVPTVAALTGAAILVVGSSGSAGPEGVKFDWKQASGVPFIEREVAERAIPRNDADIGTSTSGNLTDHLKAIAFTAGFHFAFIEQGGTSLYPSLAQRVTDPEVLRVLLSIGPTETQHFQTLAGQGRQCDSADRHRSRNWVIGNVSGPWQRMRIGPIADWRANRIK
jgi:hypothetical protein